MGKEAAEQRAGRKWKLLQKIKRALLGVAVRNGPGTTCQPVRQMLARPPGPRSHLGAMGWV